MIDEKKLLMNLNNWLFTTELNSVAYKTIEECIKAIEEQPKTDWIPCEERLPKIGELVLASITEKSAPHHRIVIEEYLGQTYWKMGIIEAWQPLPQPYKKEGAE